MLQKKHEEYRVTIRKKNIRKMLYKRRMEIIANLTPENTLEIENFKDIENFSNWESSIKNLEVNLIKFYENFDKYQVEKIIRKLNLLISNHIKNVEYMKFLFNEKVTIIKTLLEILTNYDFNCETELVKQILNLFLFFTIMEESQIDFLLKNGLLGVLLLFLNNPNVSYLYLIIYILSNVSIEKTSLFHYYREFNLFSVIFNIYDKFSFDSQIKSSLLWHFLCILKFYQSLEDKEHNRILEIFSDFMGQKNNEDMLEWLYSFDFYFEDCDDRKLIQKRINDIIKIGLNLKIVFSLKFEKNPDFLEICTKLMIYFSSFDEQTIDAVFFKEIKEVFVCLLETQNLIIKKNIFILVTNLCYFKKYFRVFFESDFIQSLLYYTFEESNLNLNKEAGNCFFVFIKNLKNDRNNFFDFLIDFEIIQKIFLYLKTIKDFSLLIDILVLILEEIKNLGFPKEFTVQIKFMNDNLENISFLDYNELILNSIENLIKELEYNN